MKEQIEILLIILLISTSLFNLFYIIDNNNKNYVTENVKLELSEYFYMVNMDNITFYKDQVVSIHSAHDDYIGFLRNTENLSDYYAIIAVDECKRGEICRVTKKSIIRNVDTSMWGPGTRLFLDIHGNGTFSSGLGIDIGDIIVITQHIKDGTIFININKRR